jgi:ABC-type lipoprotein export system ATPase subunit
MISLRGIAKSFERPGEGRLDVLKSVDFDVHRGEFTAIVGPSGSGKTTLMNILGLLDRPDAGDYTLNGRSVAELTPRERARMRNRRIGFVFQQFHLLPRTTAKENVELPLVYSDARDPEEKAIEALRRVGLEDRLTHYPSELSGGQQQRVAIARALVNEPEVILADEPTGNLDRTAGQGVMDLFLELNQGGTTLLFITHDMELARQASRVVRIHEGRVDDGPPSDQRMVEAMCLVMRQDAYNHRDLQVFEDQKAEGMSVMAMGASTGCNTVYGSTPPNNPHPYPWMN